MNDDLYKTSFFSETKEISNKITKLDKTKYLTQEYEIETGVYDPEFEIFKLELILRQGIYVLKISFRETVDEDLIDIMENATCVPMEKDPLSVIEPDTQNTFDCLILTNVKGIKYYDQYIPFNIEKNDFIIKNGNRAFQKGIIFDIVQKRIETIIDTKKTYNKEDFSLMV